MQYKKVSVNVRKDRWEIFKKLAKYKNSDTNKEIRKFIDDYIAKNNQLLLEIEAEDEKK